MWIYVVQLFLQYSYQIGIFLNNLLNKEGAANVPNILNQNLSEGLKPIVYHFVL